jgi:hypothetical protein
VLLDNDVTTVFKDWPSPDGSSHRHSYPGRDQCNQCHALAAGGALGLQAGQLNRTFDYGEVVDNQIRALAHAGLFGETPPPTGEAVLRLPDARDASQSLSSRVRSYFHSNCAHCHRPGGRWPVIDFRYQAPLVAAGEPNPNICNQIVPGNADASLLYRKMKIRDPSLEPGFQGLPMPPVGSLLADDVQVGLTRAWIVEMATCP